MIAITESGRCCDGFDIAAGYLAAMEFRQLADDLKRRGGGFTAHAEALLRARAERAERDAESVLRMLKDDGCAGCGARDGCACCRTREQAA